MSRLGSLFSRLRARARRERELAELERQARELEARAARARRRDLLELLDGELGTDLGRELEAAAALEHVLELERSSSPLGGELGLLFGMLVGPPARRTAAASVFAYRMGATIAAELENGRRELELELARWMDDGGRA